MRSHDLNEAMTAMLPPGSIMVVDGGGTALYTGYQSSIVKEGSRLIGSTAISAMGTGLPEAVGAAFAAPGRIVTVVIGDGSFLFNVQELATIRRHDLPIKVFVLNNDGYLAIRHTQAQYQDGRYYGSDWKDLFFPNVKAVAAAFQIPYTKYTDWALKMPGPFVCEWLCDPEQPTSATPI